MEALEVLNQKNVKANGPAYCLKLQKMCEPK